MGQRSQIYVRGTDKYTKKTFLVARYFQWNFAERMISRARHGIEWMHTHKKYLSLELSQLNRIFDVNFDMHDIVISSDLIEEWKRDGTQFDCTANEYLFNADNNDGRLFIDTIMDKDNDVSEIKYCFADYDNNYLGDANAYIDWERESLYDEYKEKLGLDDESFETLKKNIEYIQKNATLMTKEELKEFIEHDYDLADKPKF